MTTKVTIHVPDGYLPAIYGFTERPRQAAVDAISQAIKAGNNLLLDNGNTRYLIPNAVAQTSLFQAEEIAEDGQP